MIVTNYVSKSKVLDNMFVELSEEDATIFLGDATFHLDRSAFMQLHDTIRAALLEEEILGNQ